jgi:outer membrane lipoprotein-sorting protein
MTRYSPATRSAGIGWIVSLFLLIVFHGVAAGSATSVTRDQLKAGLLAYASISKLEATFNQTKTIKEIGVVIKSEGRMTLSRPGKVTWEVTRPSRVKVVLDEKEVRIESGSSSDANAQVFPVGGAVSDEVGGKMAEVLAWLRLDADRLYDDYSVTSVGPNQFCFTPKERLKSLFGELKLTLGKEGVVRRLEIKEKSGDLLEIDFRTRVIERRKQ